jgi:hypothetical protein
MLRILSHPRRVCSGLTRRDALQAAGAGLFGVSLPRVWAAEEAQPVVRARAKSVLFVFLFGGPSQLETLDMKPLAPDTIRGPFRPIASRTPDLLISEHLPHLAQISDRFAVVRTVTHSQNDHNACHYVQTGRPMPPAPRGAAGVDATEKDWPAIGSVVEYLDQRAAGSRLRDMPSYVYVPNRLGHIQGYDRLGQYAGWLGRGYDALATEIRKRNAQDNPYFRNCSDEELDFRLKGLDRHADLTLDRLQRRLTLLEQFDDGRRALDRSASVDHHDRMRERALALIASERIRSAFDIRQEPAALRDRYGRHLFGQSALLGRRLIEAGARFVTVLWDCPDGYSWDSHQHSDDVKQHLLPGWDQSFSALLTDLDDRGLLDETLVVCLGEMGRTPRGNDRWGRNHWSFCFPAVFAGAGIRGGTAYGRSDPHAAYPTQQPVTPEDLAATVFYALGIDPELRIPDPLGRPVQLVEHGGSGGGGAAGSRDVDVGPRLATAAVPRLDPALRDVCGGRFRLGAALRRCRRTLLAGALDPALGSPRGGGLRLWCGIGADAPRHERLVPVRAARGNARRRRGNRDAARRPDLRGSGVRSDRRCPGDGSPNRRRGDRPGRPRGGPRLHGGAPRPRPAGTL